jgi:glycosyltransferase involved in cell wall biosynthesis
MNIPMLSRYGRLGASSRLRLFQYERYLRANGIEPAPSPFFDDDYILRLYENRQTRMNGVSAFRRRIRQMRRAGNADLLWIEKEALPWMPWQIERAILPGAVPIVTDYDDAIFHNYDLHGSPAVRLLLGRKIDAVMAASALVLAGNSYLAERARAAGARRIEIVPTVVDIANYAVKPDRGAPITPKIGWIGSPTTWAAYMAPMMSVLTAVAAAEGARMLAVGAGKEAAPHPTLDTMPWSEETEVECIQAMDIGIMPLADSPWARGKCGYKLIQYMACGLPVVASPVGVNAEIVEHGVNGFLARSDDEWRQALETLLCDPGLRRQMGQAGRRKVETQYSLQVWGPRVAGLLRQAAERGTSCSI